MITLPLPKPWERLRSLLRMANHLSQEELKERIRALSLAPQIRSALSMAVDGENRDMNSWLFSHSSQDQSPLVWLAPVIGKGGATRYAWMIGFQSPLAPDVSASFERASKGAQSDPLLLQRICPPPLLFVDPLEVSQTSLRADGVVDYDEFAIFQTNYKAKRSEVPDSEQHMVLNANYVTEYRRKVLRRAFSVMEFQDMSALDQEISFLSLIHTEGHNRGHFLGPWPLDSDKNIVLYEALEEFRACIVAIRLAEHMGLMEKTLDLLATSVFLTRFLGYGFDAYCLSEQRRRTVREITVGLMFFETLRRSGAIEFNEGENLPPQIYPNLIRKTLLHSLKEIHEAEKEANRNTDHLRKLARHWYGVAFPNRNYSREAIAVYQLLSERTLNYGAEE